MRIDKTMPQVLLRNVVTYLDATVIVRRAMNKEEAGGLPRGAARGSENKGSTAYASLNGPRVAKCVTENI